MGTPFSKKNKRSAKLEAILSEAAELFNLQGTRATTLADIASRMGVTKTSLYYYARNKEALIYLCYRASCETNLGMMIEAEQSAKTGLDCLLNFVKICLLRQDEIDQGKRAHVALLIEIPTLSDEHRGEIESKIDGLFDTLQGFLLRGIKDGSLSDCALVPTTQAFLAVINWAYIWYRLIPFKQRPAAVEQLLGLIQQGISASPYAFKSIQFPSLSSLRPVGFDRDEQNSVKREAFLRVSSKMFNQRGYVATSLDDISEQLEVTKGAFYYHIKDKEDLLYQCFQRTLEMEEQMIGLACQRGTSGAQKIELILRYLFNVQHSEEGPLIGYRALPSLGTSHRQEILQQTQQISDRIGLVITEGIEDGSLRNVDSSIIKNTISGTIDGAPDVATRMHLDNISTGSSDYLRLLFNGISASE